MTVSDQVSTHNYVVTTGKIDGWLALKILAVKQFAVFDRDVVCLVKFDQVKPVVVLQWIVTRSASPRASSPSSM
jgi:hypothetical protein